MFVIIKYLAVVQGTERETSNFDAAGSNPASETQRYSPQGGEAVCKTVAIGMVGSIPTYRTIDNIINQRYNITVSTQTKEMLWKLWLKSVQMF